MPGQLPPHVGARADQHRALAQEQLDGFVAEYRQQLTVRDPNVVFRDLFAGTTTHAVLDGPNTTVWLLCAAIERLATQGGEQR